MASSINTLIFIALLSLVSFASSQQSFRPKALVLPVSKDKATLQYITHINQRTPLVSVPLTVHLGGEFLWVDCDNHQYVSSSYSAIPCKSAQCNLAGSKSCSICDTPKPKGCFDICGLNVDNPIIRTATSGDLSADIVSVNSTDLRNPGQAVSVPRFLFTCAPAFLKEGLAGGVKGMAGLGRSKMGMPSRFAEAFSFDRKFALCLSSSSSADGVLFVGNDGPTTFLPNVVVNPSNLLNTPLLINPVSTASAYFTGEKSVEYFIGVKSIKINNNIVPLNKTLLTFDNKEGIGGTKISTVHPYTILETSIYKAVTEAFVKALSGVPRVAAVKPFKTCYSAKSLGSTRVGPAVPQIDLVLQSSSVYWRIFGANSMVYVNNDEVVCLGFVDGGLEPRTSIVIGGHQLEDNFLQFDIAASKLWFSSSLLFRQTTCANFNFTSTA